MLILANASALKEIREIEAGWSVCGGPESTLPVGTVTTVAAPQEEPIRPTLNQSSRLSEDALLRSAAVTLKMS